MHVQNAESSSTTKSQAWFVTTALAGIAAACLVGYGEYLLHYDALARFGDGYEFMRDISAERSTRGHSIAVFGAVLYPVGCYHLYLMLSPASKFLAATAAFVSYANATRHPCPAVAAYRSVIWCYLPMQR